MTDEDYSWLSLAPEPAPIKLPERLPSEIVPAVSEALSTRQALVVALRQIDAGQRVFLEELVSESFDVKRALRATRDRGFPASRSILDRKWMHEPNFARALETLRNYGSLTLGISKTAILAKLEKLADDCRALVTLEDKFGNVVTKPVDAAAARSALETLARISGVLTAQEAQPAARPGPGLHITFTHNDRQSTMRVGEVVDAEVIDLPTPKKEG